MTAPNSLTDGPIYLDYNATTPIDPAALEAMLPFLTGGFGNPSSEHRYGFAPRGALERAREQVAALLGVSDGQIVFTGSGSEADNLAIRGAVLATGSDRPHIITQATEHPAVLEACRALQRWHSAEITVLPVNTEGLVHPGDLAAAITPRTTLVSIMAANNETGALQPITELARISHEYDVLFHCDAAQTVGKIPLDVTTLDVDLLTVVGHKIYAPKGIAALYVRSGVSLEPLIYGGGQEYGLRAGTENVAFAVALGAAARLAADDLAAGGDNRIRLLRDRLHDRLCHNLPNRVQLNGPLHSRLPNTLNVGIHGIIGHDLLEATPGVAASTGSACHSGNHHPSPVLTAMGMNAERALSALRLSLGRWTTQEDIDRAADLLTVARPAAD